LIESILEIDDLFIKVDESVDFQKYQSAKRKYRRLKRSFDELDDFNSIQLLKEYSSYKLAVSRQITLLSNKAKDIEIKLADIYFKQLAESNQDLEV
jgi:hypothetical protein